MLPLHPGPKGAEISLGCTDSRFSLRGWAPRAHTRLLTCEGGVGDVVLFACKIHTFSFIVLLLKIVAPGRRDLLKFPHIREEF